MARKTLRARPALEGLEERQMLSGNNPMGPFGEPINEQDLRKYNVQIINIEEGSTTADRRKFFTTPEGGRIVLNLFGLGTLDGTTQDPDGALNIVYDNTTSDSQIVARVVGGNGRAKLRTFRDADVPLGSLSVSDNRLGTVNLSQFDLVAGGAFNASGGVRTVQLASMGPATVMDLQSLPVQTSQLTNDLSSSQQQDIIQWIVAPDGSVQVAGVGGLQAPGAIAGTTTSSSGEAFETRITASGQVELIPVATTTTGDTGTPPPGVNLLVDRIDGLGGAVPLGNPQIFGYSPADNALIRFDAATGAALQGMPLTTPVPANTDAGVGLSRVDGVQVVLVGTDLTVQAFDVLTGSFVGSFTAANLVPGGFSQITGIGTTDEGTGLVDGPSNLVQPVDVQASLASGVAVPTSVAFQASNGFTLSGGATGIAGAPVGFLTGGAKFDSFEPLTDFFGMLTVTTSDDSIRESARTQVSSPSSLTNDVAPGNTPFAFGSIDLNPALVTAVRPSNPSDPASPVVNVVTLYSANNLSSVGTISLRHPNRLTGLSESVHPEVAGSSIINVVGVLNQIVSRSIRGAVVNTLGYLAQIRAGRVSDSAFVGLPVGHVDIAHRQNVSITSSESRPVGKRGGVFVSNTLRPVGPIAPPVIRPVYVPGTASPQPMPFRRA